MAQVVSSIRVFNKAYHIVVWKGNLGKVLFADLPKRRDCITVFKEGDGETILLISFSHELEYIVLDITIVPDTRLQPPVVLVRTQKRMLIKKAQKVPAHVLVACIISLVDVFGKQGLFVFLQPHHGLSMEESPTGRLEPGQN